MKLFYLCCTNNILQRFKVCDFQNAMNIYVHECRQNYFICFNNFLILKFITRDACTYSDRQLKKFYTGRGMSIYFMYFYVYTVNMIHYYLIISIIRFTFKFLSIIQFTSKSSSSSPNGFTNVSATINQPM